MKILKWIPEARMAVVELADGTRQTISGNSEAEIIASMATNNSDNESKKAQKQAEKKAEKEAQAIVKLETKATKNLPDILAHLAALSFRDSCTYADQLEAALNRLER